MPVDLCPFSILFYIFHFHQYFYLHLLLCFLFAGFLIYIYIYIYIYICNGVEWSKDKTQAAESIKWRPQQAYGSNHVLLAQPQTVFSTHTILTRTHR